LNLFKIILDFPAPLIHILNMFNSTAGTEKGQASRTAILETALDLFRRQGLDEARMRDVAREAGVALGAAYYYFPSKEAIVQAYYDHVQVQHEQRLKDALAGKKLRERLGIVFHSKLDILAKDQKLLGAIFRYSGTPDHPLSILGPATRSTRAQSIAVFANALEGESLPKDLQESLPVALWALQMGILIFFIYDQSPEHKRTRKLVDGALDLAVTLLTLTKSPLLKPFRGRLFSLLREVELLPLEGRPMLSEPKEESL
jgi:AcrR family transcriptional regulator